MGESVNGLNQLTAQGANAATYDARGNLTSALGKSYTYASENMLITGPNSSTLAYDPALRLYQTSGGGVVTRFGYDGVDPSTGSGGPLIAEYDASNALQRRYVHGPGSDEPLTWYEGSGTSDRRFPLADERGSIIAITNGSGSVTSINAYDEYGVPATSNVGRFGYTGQTWLSEVGVNYYKARTYLPALGRFMQTDPIGYGDGMNLYAYVGGDPVNGRDPSGLSQNAENVDDDYKPEIIVTAFERIRISAYYGSYGIIRSPLTIGKGAGAGTANKVEGDGGGDGGDSDGDTIVVTAKKDARQSDQKKLPKCAQNFLKGRIASNPADITLHKGGSVWNWFGNSVTYGSDIYLAGDSFGRTDANALIHKFHEIEHTSQNAKMDLSALHHGAAYVAFVGHDASPLEQAADRFAKSTYNAYKAAELDKTCPF